MLAGRNRSRDPAARRRAGRGEALNAAARPSPVARALLATEVVAALTAASLLVRLLPSRRLSRLLGAATPAGGTRTATAADARQARRIGRAVERAAAALPWKPVCLPQAIATSWMLRRRRIPCECHLGVTSTRPLGAHAWVTVAEFTVQGAGVETPSELARFVY